MLKDSGGRGTGSVSANRFRKTLVAGEVALAVMVVVCAALLANSFVRMLHVDLGFDGERVLVAELQLLPKYKTAAGISQFYDSAMERLKGMPGVERAAAARFVPGGDSGNIAPLIMEGRPMPLPGQSPIIRTNLITPGLPGGDEHSSDCRAHHFVSRFAGRNASGDGEPDGSEAVFRQRKSAGETGPKKGLSTAWGYRKVSQVTPFPLHGK